MPKRQKGGVFGRLHVDSAERLVDGDAGMAPELSHPRTPTKLKGKRDTVGVAPHVSESLGLVRAYELRNTIRN